MDEKVNVNFDSNDENLDNNFEKIKDFQGEGYNLNPTKPTAQTMNDKEYIKERIDDQIRYFGRKSSIAQKKYKLLKRWEIFIAASIPVLIAFAALGVFEHITIIETTVINDEGKQIIKPIFSLSTILQIIAALGGVAIVVLKGVTDLEEYFKTWKEYRSMEMNLLQEKYKFRTRTEPYDEANAYSLLVEQVEQTLNMENQKWRLMKQQTNEFSKKIEEKMLQEFEKRNLSNESQTSVISEKDDGVLG